VVRTPNTQILIDAGPDFRQQALRERIAYLDGVLLTHAHFDHIAGLDDLRPLTEQNGVISIYANLKTVEEVRQRFSYAFNQSSAGSTRPLLELVTVTSPFTIGDLRIIPFTVHHGTWHINAYRIGPLVYITDASYIPPESMEIIQGAKVLVINALRPAPHPTHFSLNQCIQMISLIQPEQAWVVHTTHHLGYEETNAQLPEGASLAYDGLCIQVEES
jgi:phosphoribosyl 1,2-cyclic phosphate phosphodiesterase